MASFARWEQIHEFWFGDFLRSGQIAPAVKKRWFEKSQVFDDEIRSEFLVDIQDALAGSLDAWIEHPRSALALILLTDQFTRNVFREQPNAFAGDEKARQVARLLAPQGAHHKLQPIERVFVYLPFEHAEDLTEQKLCIQLFEELLQDVGPEERAEFSGYLDYAIQHERIINRFGRFPHRNQVLSRPSTPEEVEFLRRPGSSF